MRLEAREEKRALQRDLARALDQLDLARSELATAEAARRRAGAAEAEAPVLARRAEAAEAELAAARREVAELRAAVSAAAADGERGDETREERKRAVRQLHDQLAELEQERVALKRGMERARLRAQEGLSAARTALAATEAREAAAAARAAAAERDLAALRKAHDVEGRLAGAEADDMRGEVRLLGMRLEDAQRAAAARRKSCGARPCGGGGRR